MPCFFLNASAIAFDGPVDAELYKLTVPSFFAASTTFGSLAANAFGERSSDPAPAIAAPIFRSVRRSIEDEVKGPVVMALSSG
jgi:hypothetical protein